MSDFETMPIPLQKDGEPNFAAIALVIVEQLPTAQAGEPIEIAAKMDGRLEIFRAVHPEPGRLIVERACLGQRFSSSLFMALKDLAPRWIEEGEV